MSELLPEDVNYISQLIPWPVARLMQDSKQAIVLAGGFIRSVISGEPIADVDLWVPSAEVAKEMATKLRNPTYSDAPTKLIETQNAMTVTGLEWPVQFVSRWTFDTPQAVIGHFDFTIARACIWWDAASLQFRSLCDERFYQDIAGRRLVYREETPMDGCGGSMIRLLKFYRKGYRAPLTSLAMLIERCTSHAAERKTDVLGILAEIDPSVNPREWSHAS